MEYDGEQENSVSGSVPEFGAIFMSNRTTKKECFKRKLFGLPPTKANFVKKVKAGMVLFLFEYETRKLYGVFEACSDGAMNIVSDAFKSSWKQFPAQIRFTTIWDCVPLSEDDFRDAISDNYFSAYKFNFGLSKDQVGRLLSLFNSRKAKVQRSQIPVTGSRAVKPFKKSGLGTVRVTEKGRSITTVRAENELNMDTSIDPVNLTDNPGLHRLNLDPSGYSNKLILDTGDSVVERQHRLSLTGRHLEEPVISNLLRSKSFGNAVDTSNHPVSTLGALLCRPKFPSFQYRHPLPFGMDRNSTLVQEHAAYNSNLADNLVPFSRSQLVPTHAETENLGRHQILDASTDLGDYIPLSPSPDHYDPSSPIIHFSGAGYPEKMTGGLNTCEHYKGLCFPDPSVATFSFGRDGDFELENMKSSSFASNQGLSLLQEDVCHLESQRYDYYKHDPIYYTSGLHSDTQKKRTSVFSRLVVPSERIVQEIDDYTGYGHSMDSSVEELMEILQQTQNYMRKPVRKPNPFIARHDDDENFENITQMEMNVHGALPNENETWSNGELAEKIPILNFKRRSERRKMQGESKGSECVQGTKSEDLLGKQHKKRKLIRPTFGNKESSSDKGIISDSCPNMHLSRQEIFDGEVNNTGSGGASVKSDGDDKNENRLFQNVGVPNLICPLSSEVINGKCENGSSKVGSNMERVSHELVGTKGCLPNVQGSLEVVHEGEEKTESCEVSDTGGGGHDKEKRSSQNFSIQNAVCPVSCEGSGNVEHGSSNKESTDSVLVAAALMLKGSCQEICERNGNGESGEMLVDESGEMLVESDGDKGSEGCLKM